MNKSIELSADKTVVNRSYDWNNQQTKAIETKRLPLQATHIFPLEFPVLQEGGIEQAKRVLDFGCGDGTWTQLLAEALPGIEIVGADKSPLLVNLAKEKHPEGAFHLIENFEALPDLLRLLQPDAVVARFVLQHLPISEVGLFLTAISTTLPQARVFLIDVDDSSFTLSPPCAAFHTLLEKRGQTQRSLGGDRQIGRKLTSYTQAAGFENIVEKTVRISSEAMGFDNWKSIVFPFLFADASEENAQLIEEVKAWADLPNRESFLKTYLVSGQSKYLHGIKRF